MKLFMYKKYFSLVRLISLRFVKFITFYKPVFRIVSLFPNKLIRYLSNR